MRSPGRKTCLRCCPGSCREGSCGWGVDSTRGNQSSWPLHASQRCSGAAVDSGPLAASCPALPQWVADCVLRGRYPVSRELKMAFQLMPLPVSPCIQVMGLIPASLHDPAAEN